MLYRVSTGALPSNPSPSPAHAWEVALPLLVAATCCVLPLLLVSGVLVGWLLFSLPTAIATGALGILSLYWWAGRHEKRAGGPTEGLSGTEGE